MEATRTLRPRQLALLDQLEAIFFAEGYRRIAMSELAKRLKCSKRALYECAPNRKQLFVLIIERWSRRVRAMGLAAEASASDTRGQLEAYLEPGVTETRAVTEAFLEDLNDLPAARAILESHQFERMEHLKTILESGIRSGTFRPMHAHLVAGICLAGIEKINEPQFLRTAGLGYSEAFSELYHLLMTGLEIEAPATR